LNWIFYIRTWKHFDLILVPEKFLGLFKRKIRPKMTVATDKLVYDISKWLDSTTYFDDISPGRPKVLWADPRDSFKPVDQF
jgi:hypothetical protein